MTNEPTSPSARVAVLIDCDNISWQRATAIVTEAATHGVLGVKRGYGDWGSPNLSGWRRQLTPLAIQPVQQIAYVTGKGATDIALVIDAMDLLYSGQVDTFCLVASDSDYTRLAMRLREAGKRVVGIGAKQTPAASAAPATGSRSLRFSGAPRRRRRLLRSPLRVKPTIGRSSLSTWASRKRQVRQLLRFPRSATC